MVLTEFGAPLTLANEGNCPPLPTHYYTTAVAHINVITIYVTHQVFFTHRNLIYIQSVLGELYFERTLKGYYAEVVEGKCVVAILKVKHFLGLQKP